MRTLCDAYACMRNACIMHASSMHCACIMHYACIMHALCIHHFACIMHALCNAYACMRNACLMHASRMHCACIMHASCMHYARIKRSTARRWSGQPALAVCTSRGQEVRLGQTKLPPIPAVLLQSNGNKQLVRNSLKLWLCSFFLSFLSAWKRVLSFFLSFFLECVRE